MKLRSSAKLVFTIALASSMIALTGCSTIINKVVEQSNAREQQSLEKVDKELAKEAEKINGSFEDKPSPGISTSNSLMEGFKVVGDSNFGYFQLPDNFVVFKDVEAASSDMMQYSNPTGTFILTARSIPTTASHEDLVAAMVAQMQGSGPSVLATESTVDGNKATNLFQYYKDEDYTLHVWIVEENQARKFISLEYQGKQEDLKNKIIENYSANQKPEKGVSSSTKSDELYVDESGHFQIIEKSDYHLHMKIYGDFEAGTSYFLSLLTMKDFSNEYSDDFIAQKDAEGVFLDVDMHTKNKLSLIDYRVDIINSLDSPSSTRYFKSMEFQINN